MSPGELVRTARRAAGLTQRELALRTGTTQSAIARLENDQTNPTVETLWAMLHATGHDLTLGLHERADLGVDESLIRGHLEAPATARLAGAEQMYESGREIAIAGARSRGELVD